MVPAIGGTADRDAPAKFIQRILCVSAPPWFVDKSAMEFRVSAALASEDRGDRIRTFAHSPVTGTRGDDFVVARADRVYSGTNRDDRICTRYEPRRYKTR